MTADSAGRLAYLRETAELLWPGADARSRVVLPSRRRPRLLVPRRPARVGAAALVRYTAQQGARERLIGSVAASVTLTGLARLLPPAGAWPGTGDPAAASIDSLLEQVLGRPVVTTLPLTPRRANRKPVLQVFDQRGRTLAFAKIGVSPLARDLVDDEARALQRLAASGLGERGDIEVARVRHHGPWHGLQVLVTSALPSGRRVAPGASLLHAAMRAVADTGDAAAMPRYLDALRARVAALAAPGPDWRGLLDGLAASPHAADLPTGAWHGDWTTWNCARHGHRLVVWDWERYASPAPRGFDALHFRLNDSVGKRRTGFAAGAAQLVAQAPTLLAPWDLSPAQARLVAGLYVLDIALRYVTDGDATAADTVGQWAVPAVRDAAEPDRRGATAR